MYGQKFEAQREELSVNGLPDVDLVLTTRELSRMIKAFGIDFPALPDSDFDNPLGISTGAGTIFGATGGVMEAALRTVADILTGQSSDSIDYMQVRGQDEGIKEGRDPHRRKSDQSGGGSRSGQCRRLMERIKGGEDFDFIEIMACRAAV